MALLAEIHSDMHHDGQRKKKLDRNSSFTSRISLAVLLRFLCPTINSLTQIFMNPLSPKSINGFTYIHSALLAEFASKQPPFMSTALSRL